MLCIINGGLGSGKSLFLTIYGKFWKQNNPNKTLVSNFTLYDIEYEEFSISKFVESKYNDALILADEFYQYVDSRSSMSELNKLFSHTLFQTRKKSIDMFMAVQLRGTIDVRFRALSDLTIECNRTNFGFEYRLSQPNSNRFAYSFLSWDKAHSFFKFYDTNEIISHTEKDSSKYLTKEKKIKLAEKKGNKCYEDWKKQCDKVGNYLKNGDYPTINKSFTKVWCVKNKIDNSMFSLIYNYIKGYLC
jgi:hypothetical protein